MTAKREPNLTIPGLVSTCDGAIPYKKINLANIGEIEAPVAVTVEAAASHGQSRTVRPMRNSHGDLVYALPSGWLTTT